MEESKRICSSSQDEFDEDPISADQALLILKDNQHLYQKYGKDPLFVDEDELKDVFQRVLKNRIKRNISEFPFFIGKSYIQGYVLWHVTDDMFCEVAHEVLDEINNKTKESTRMFVAEYVDGVYVNVRPRDIRKQFSPDMLVKTAEENKRKKMEAEAEEHVKDSLVSQVKTRIIDMFENDMTVLPFALSFDNIPCLSNLGSNECDRILEKAIEEINETDPQSKHILTLTYFSKRCFTVNAKKRIVS
jgi:hypothetical protein